MLEADLMRSLAERDGFAHRRGADLFAIDEDPRPRMRVESQEPALRFSDQHVLADRCGADWRDVDEADE